MKFKDKLFYVSLNEYLINKKDRIELGDNYHAEILGSDGRYYEPLIEPTFQDGKPSIDFIVTIYYGDSPIYRTYYQKISNIKLSELLNQDKETIKKFIFKKETRAKKYFGYSYANVFLVQAAGGLCPVLQDYLSCFNPDKIVRKKVDNKFITVNNK